MSIKSYSLEYRSLLLQVSVSLQNIISEDWNFEVFAKLIYHKRKLEKKGCSINFTKSQARPITKLVCYMPNKFLYHKWKDWDMAFLNLGSQSSFGLKGIYSNLDSK